MKKHIQTSPLCPYHALVLKKKQLLAQIDRVNAVILHSPRQYQPIEIFNFRMRVKERLQQEVDAIKKVLLRMDEEHICNTAVVMKLFKSSNIQFKIQDGQVHVPIPYIKVYFG